MSLNARRIHFSLEWHAEYQCTGDEETQNKMEGSSSDLVVGVWESLCTVLTKWVKEYNEN